jgi:hypothetical protein
MSDAATDPLVGDDARFQARFQGLVLRHHRAIEALRLIGEACCLDITSDQRGSLACRDRAGVPRFMRCAVCKAQEALEADRAALEEGVPMTVIGTELDLVVAGLRRGLDADAALLALKDTEMRARGFRNTPQGWMRRDVDPSAPVPTTLFPVEPSVPRGELLSAATSLLMARIQGGQGTDIPGVVRQAAELIHGVNDYLGSTPAAPR